MPSKPTIDFTTFPVLTTERLILREFRWSDAADVQILRGDPIVQSYDDPVIHTREEALSLIPELHEEYMAQKGVSWAVTLSEQDVVLGAFSLHHWDQYHRRAEIRYGIAHTHWGRGIGSEALSAIVRFGFEQLDLNRIYAHTIAENHELALLLEKFGFQREGTLRKHSWEEDGTFYDGTLYGLLREEFIS